MAPDKTNRLVFIERPATGLFNPPSWARQKTGVDVGGADELGQMTSVLDPDGQAKPHLSNNEWDEQT